MVDDIMPSEPKNTDDGKENKNNQYAKDEPKEKASKNTQESAKPIQPIRPYATPNSTNEEGFVVTPGGKEISGNPFSKLTGWVAGLSKRNKVILSAVMLLVVLGLGGGLFALISEESEPEPVAVEIVPEEELPKPTKEPSSLTGVMVPLKTNKRPVTSVQIENSPDARPQSGLLEAGVVFEAIAEGGITRFNANYQEAMPDYIGPIRSVRPYYAQLSAAFDPIFVHAGGSGAGLAEIRRLGLKDLDHGPNAGAFQRVSDRFAPHNLYSSTAALDKVAKERGYSESDVKSFARKEEEKGKAVKAGTIDLNISSYLYNVQYKYNPKSNTYNRTMGGAPHKDQRSGKQISPKVVIAIVTDYGISGIYSTYKTIGTGPAFIFQDGQVIKATWRKSGHKDQFSFRNASNKSMQINAGKTWITMMGDQNDIKFNP